MITIREYQPNDAADLAKIFYNTVHQINCKDYTKEQLEVWAPLSSIEPASWLKKFSKTKPIIALVKDKIVGFAELEANGHIDCFYVHHEWIGKKVGSILMQEILKIAKTHKITHLFSEVSITAKPFFEKFGFNTN
jgi:putative acetyltransferase